jgi:hypothetical protein
VVNLFVNPLSSLGSGNTVSSSIIFFSISAMTSEEATNENIPSLLPNYPLQINAIEKNGKKVTLLRFRSLMEISIMQPLKIVIVDPQDNSLERRLNMVNTFTQLPNVRVTEYKKLDSDTEDVFLCIIHCGDNDLKDAVRAKWRIWYGGLEGQDNRAENGEYKIWRGISSDNFLTENEAAQIIDFFLKDALGDIPECFLERTPTLSSISALSILCQGYLVTNSDSDNDIVKDALKAMGWNTFKTSSNYAKIIHTDLSTKQSETQKTSWWLKPFDNDSVDTIISKAKKEWDAQKSNVDFAPVEKLLKELEKETITDPVIVTNAYLKISDRLAQE